MAVELKPDRSMNTAQGFFRIRSFSTGSRCFYSKYNINGVERQAKTSERLKKIFITAVPKTIFNART